jgi:hypothetical protein
MGKLAASIKQLTVTTEQWVLALIILGLPLIAAIWFDWRAALTTLILTLIGIGLVKLRYS